MTTIFELVKPPSPCRIPRALPMRSFAVILLLFFLCSAVLCAGWLVGWLGDTAAGFSLLRRVMHGPITIYS